MESLSFIEEYYSYFRRYVNHMIEDFQIKTMFSFLIAYLSGLFGEDWWIVQILFIFIFADLILGLITAVKNRKTLSQIKLNQGILKFFAYSFTIIMVWLIQRMIQYSINVSIPLLPLFATYQCLTEISSITKHLLNLDVPIPSSFAKLVTITSSKIDERIVDMLHLENKKNDTECMTPENEDHYENEQSENDSLNDHTSIADSNDISCNKNNKESLVNEESIIQTEPSIDKFIEKEETITKKQEKKSKQ